MNRAPVYVYRVETGEFFEDGVLVATGYSGTEACRNNPAFEHFPGAGPIPRGRYEIGPAFYSTRTGPMALPLTAKGHDARGRSGFQIHGDGMRAPGAASSGCVVLPRVVRESIAGAVRIWKRVELDVI